MSAVKRTALEKYQARGLLAIIPQDWHEKFKDELRFIVKTYLHRGVRETSEKDRRRLAKLCTEALLRSTNPCVAFPYNVAQLMVFARHYVRGVYEESGELNVLCERIPHEMHPDKCLKAGINPLKLVSEPHNYPLGKPIHGIVWETLTLISEELDRGTTQSPERPGDGKGTGDSPKRRRRHPLRTAPKRDALSQNRPRRDVRYPRSPALDQKQL